MKLLQIVFFSIILISCGGGPGGQQGLNSADSSVNISGDSYGITNSDAEREVEALLSDCGGFDEDCFFDKLNNVVRSYCRNSRDYDEENLEECEAVFRQQMNTIYFQKQET